MKSAQGRVELDRQEKIPLAQNCILCPGKGKTPFDEICVKGSFYVL